MFNIGPQELLLVLIVALIIVGPKRLPDLGRTIGRALNEFRKIQDEVKDMVKFDLGTDPTEADEAMAAAPSYADDHYHDDDGGPGEEEGNVVDGDDPEAGDDEGDGMTHSERVIAAMPDPEGDDAGGEDVEPVAPLPASEGDGGSATPADVPPAAAAE